MPLFTFRKKSEEASQGQPAREEIPLQRIQQMRSQGIANDQIISQLQSEGYSSAQIFDGLNQADMTQAPGPVMASPEPGPMVAEMEGPSDEGMDKERVEEMVEAIIDERWEELMKNINKIVEWKGKTESRMTVIEEQVKSIKEDFYKLQAALVGKIGEYDQNILNVGMEIKAMEKVFQKVLPQFTENVNELSRVTQSIKKPKNAPG